MYTHVHTRTYTHACTHTYIQTHTHTHTHARTHARTHTHAHTHIHAHTRTYKHTHTRTHARTHAHTHTHTDPCISIMCVQAKQVAEATNILCEAANNYVTEVGNEDELISAAKSVAAGTTALLMACNVKSDWSSVANERLQVRGKPCN